MPDNVPNTFQEPDEEARSGLSEPAPPAAQSPPIDPSRTHGLPSIDSLETGSDLTAFMSPAVSETVRRQALRKWFHLPGFNRRDGLDDYDEDYRQFKPLGEVVTAHLRHQMQRLIDGPADSCPQDPGQTAALQPSGLPDGGGKKPAATEARPTQPLAPKEARDSAGGLAAGRGHQALGGAVPGTALLWNSVFCARGSVERPGCTRCRDACPQAAIFFDGEGLKIRPERCNGQGACSAACPTEALRPADFDSSRMLKQMLTDIRTAPGTDGERPWALFCGMHVTDEALQGLQKRLPASILVLRSHRAAGPGPEAWLAAMAMGAGRIILLADAPTPVQEEHLRLARAIIAGLDLDAEAWLLAADGPNLEEQAHRLPRPEPFAPAAWEPSEEKRALLWQAIDHLRDQAPGAPFQVPLDPQAPLGEVRLESSRCTLCMACVGVCPTGALQHGSDRPQVRFRERDCVQCGLCRQVCPEQAVTLIPRICYDRNHTKSARVLHQTDPLCCSVCGAPFATPAMVAAIAQKLASHWMYQDPSAKDRLTMCRDCRIQNLYASRLSSPSGGAAKGKR